MVLGVEGTFWPAYTRCGRHETPWQVASVEPPVAKSRHSKFKSKGTLQSSEKSI